MFSARDDFNGRRFTVGGSRQDVGIQDQRHISVSIFSESFSIRALMRAVSFRKRFSLPICLTQGLPSDLALAASLSLTASVTNSRRGMPRSAATDLARRKMVSGISSVVFIKLCSHIYGNTQANGGGRNLKGDGQLPQPAVWFDYAATDTGLIWCGRNRKSGGKTAALPKKALAAGTGRHRGGLQVFVSW